MPFRAVVTRRLTAYLLVVSFGLFSAESLLADTHDGDATHEELAQVDGVQAHAASHVAHGDAPDAALTAAPDDAGHRHPGERPLGESGHEQHSCHCAHAHG